MFEQLTTCDTKPALSQVALAMVQDIGFDLWGLAAQVLPAGSGGDDCVFTIDNLPSDLRTPRLRAFTASARGPANDRRHHGIPYWWLIEADIPADLPLSAPTHTPASTSTTPGISGVISPRGTSSSWAAWTTR